MAGSFKAAAKSGEDDDTLLPETHPLICGQRAINLAFVANMTTPPVMVTEGVAQPAAHMVQPVESSVTGPTDTEGDERPPAHVAQLVELTVAEPTGTDGHDTCLLEPDLEFPKHAISCIVHF